MDTPGHVDFAYEVSPLAWPPARARSWWWTPRQGVEAQTLANVYQAIDNDHEIVPVLNKIDLPAAEPERVRQQIEDVIGLDASDAVAALGQDRRRHPRACWRPSSPACPPPKGDADAPLKALLVDAWYDAYLGVVVLVRVFDGALQGRPAGPDDADRRRATRSTASGVFTPKRTDVDEPGPRRDRLHHRPDQGGGRRRRRRHHHRRAPPDRRGPARLPADVQPVVFCGLFPVDAADFEDLRAAVGRLRLNDASFTYEMETSAALGFGFRCGFLGLLHLEIIQERLTREFDLDLIATAPSVIYKITPDRRRRDRAAQPGRHARPGEDRLHRRALDQGHHPHARRIPRRGDQALPGPPRRAARALLRRHPRAWWSTTCR